LPRTTALHVLVRASKLGRPSSEVLVSSLTRRELSARDRDLAQQLIQGVWRLRGSLDALLAICSKRPLEQLDDHVLWALRLGAYQLVSLDRVPSRAAVHATVEALKTTRSSHASGFVNAVLRQVAALPIDVVDEPAPPSQGDPGTLPTPGAAQRSRRCLPPLKHNDLTA
jgi:16S rRNA (cytosine967-C5)-methyltransferase